MARPPPLSPHLEIYKLPLTAVLSFSHRLTGVMLVLGLMMIALVLLLAAFLIIASLHARLGLDTIIEDYVSDQRLRRHARWLSGLLLNGSLSMALLALGAMTLGAPS